MRIPPTQRVLNYGAVYAGVAMILLGVVLQGIVMTGLVLALIVLVLALL